MSCECPCHRETNVPQSCWCLGCVDNHLNWNKLFYDFGKQGIEIEFD